MKKILFFLIISSICFAQTSKISIKLRGIEEIVGSVSIGLFSNPEGFPKRNKDALGIRIKVNSDSLEHTFEELMDGEYAIAIYHDENDNEELDRSFFGMPSEDYVFSNYATGSFGPPSFEDAKFDLIDSVFIELDFNK